MEAESRIAKDGRSGREVGRDRGGRQTQNGDGISKIEIKFTRPGKTHQGSDTPAETTEGSDTSCGLSNGRRQRYRVRFGAMGPRKMAPE